LRGEGVGQLKEGLLVNVNVTGLLGHAGGGGADELQGLDVSAVVVVWGCVSRGVLGVGQGEEGCGVDGDVACLGDDPGSGGTDKFQRLVR